jgi:hypothetical protein
MARARAELGEIVSAIEFQDRRALELVLRHAPQLRDPMGSSAHAFYVLIETSGYVCEIIELGAWPAEWRVVRLCFPYVF